MTTTARTSPQLAQAQAIARLIDIRWFKNKYRLQDLDDASALREYLCNPKYHQCSPSVYFNAAYYLCNNPDVAKARLHPLQHYINHGDQEGRKPNPLFDPGYYRMQLLERGIAIEGELALCHFLQHHADLGLAPSLEFDPRGYLELNPELQKDGFEPLAHYLEFGKTEGRIWFKAVAAPNRMDVRQLCLSQHLLMRENPARTWFAGGDWFERGAFAPPCPRPQQPRFSIIIPCWESNPYYLRQCLSSALLQSSRNFELVIVDDGSKKQRNRSLLRMLGKHGATLVLSDTNGGISCASNAGAAQARGEWLLFLDHDDLLHPQALAALEQELERHPDAGYMFSDAAKISANGDITSFHYKPGWDPCLLDTYMYAGQLLCIRRSLFQQLQGFDARFDGCQDHDLALRVAEAGIKVRHLPQVLYFWRAIPGSTALAAAAKPYAHDAAKKAITLSLRRRGLNAKVKAAPWAAKVWANFFQLGFPHQGPEVSVIIPTRDNIDMLEKLVRSIRKKTRYQSYRIVILADAGVDSSIQHRIHKLDAQVEVGKFCHQDGHFSFSRKVNAGVNLVSTPYVLLLNDDTEVVSPNWLSDMMAYAQMEDVGAVGAQLLYADGKVQHAGISIGLEGGRAGHVGKGLPPGNDGYLSLRAATRAVFGVTAACLLIAREKYLAIDGFDEQTFPLAYNDVDFCARLLQKGWRNIYVATAVLMHYEGVTRQRKDRLPEMLAYTRRYGMQRDPYFSPHWSSSEEQISPLTRSCSQTPRGQELLFISHNGELQGATRILCDLAQHLHGKGKPRFYLPPGNIAYRRIEQEFEIGRLNAIVTAQDDTLALSQKILLAEQVLQQTQPLAVICNTLLNLPTVLAARRLGIHVLWIIHESEGHHFFKEYDAQLSINLLPQAMLSANHVVFVSADCRRRYQEYDVAGNFSVIRNGINHPPASFWKLSKPALRRQFQYKPDELVLLNVGTLCARKAQKNLLQLAHFMESENIFLKLRFVLIGPASGDYQTEMEEEISELGFYRERFQFTGEIKDPAPYYRAADVFIFTSSMEAYPTVLCEALAHGLPVLSTPVEGAADILFHQDMGLIAPIKEHRLWVEFIQKMQNATLRAEYAQAAQMGAAILPQWEQVAAEYRKLLPPVLFSDEDK